VNLKRLALRALGQLQGLSQHSAEWDTSVGIDTGYVLDGQGSIPYREDFSLLHSVLTGSGANPAS
jgi:hypothetical protein